MRDSKARNKTSRRKAKRYAERRLSRCVAMDVFVIQAFAGEGEIVSHFNAIPSATVKAFLDARRGGDRVRLPRVHQPQDAREPHIQRLK